MTLAPEGPMRGQFGAAVFANQSSHQGEGGRVWTSS
jgi:hypothetical protein